MLQQIKETDITSLICKLYNLYLATSVSCKKKNGNKPKSFIILSANHTYETC